VSAYLGTSLGKRKLSFTREELERAAKTAYTAAKNSWLAKVDREEDEDAEDPEADELEATGRGAGGFGSSGR